MSAETPAPYTDAEIRRFAAAWLFLCSRGYQSGWPYDRVRVNDVYRANRIAKGEDAIPERIAARTLAIGQETQV